MTTKRIILILTILIGTYFSSVIGKRLLLSHYRQKADVALFLAGDYKKAIHYYNKLIWWHPDIPGLYYNRGDAYRYDNQHKKAIKDYEKSIEIGINDSLQAILRIALSAKKMGNTSIEENYLLNLFEISQTNKENTNEFWASCYHLGQLEFKRENYSKAIHYYNLAHSVKPTNMEIYHRANAYYAFGKLDSAINDYNQSIQFVKRDYVKKFPNSIIAICDTCGFPFGTLEYELLAESHTETIIESLERFSNNEEIRELNEKLKRTVKNSR